MKKHILFLFAMALLISFTYGQKPIVPHRPQPAKPVPTQPTAKQTPKNKPPKPVTKPSPKTKPAPKPVAVDRSYGQWVDLGLPSGTLWKNSNETNHSHSRGLYTFDEADEKFGANLPDEIQIEELLKHTKSQWTTRNGVIGRLFTSKNNGNSIFLPANGAQSGGKSAGNDNVSVYSSNVGAYYLYFNSRKVGATFDFYYEGRFSVRLVQD